MDTACLLVAPVAVVWLAALEELMAIERVQKICSRRLQVIQANALSGKVIAIEDQR
jgi:hypothetical protein